MRKRNAIARAALALAVAGTCVVAHASDSRDDSGDTLKQAQAEHRALYKQVTLEAKAGGPTDADVGDAASFGKFVKYIGLGQSGIVFINPDCTTVGPLGPDDRCVTTVAAPGTTIVDEHDLGRIKLPAKASTSILCHAITSFPFYHFNNPTAGPVTALARFGVGFTIENPLLLDPALIDPGTGLPFGGVLEVPFGSLLVDQPTLQAGEQGLHRQVDTRFCIAGVVSKRSLVENYGLTSTQADDFFKQPMTIKLNVSGAARYVDDWQGFFGVRLFGD